MSTQDPPSAVEVSVIVPVYNAERFIGKCVASLLASDYDRSGFEIICVDNNSSDGSLRILKSFEPAIHVYVEAKRGPSAARNAGLRMANGVFVAFTDADCIVAPGWIAAMVRALQNTPVDAVGGRILARPCAGAIDRFGELVHDHQNAIEVCHPPYMISMNVAMRRDLLISMGGFDERWLRIEDVDLSYRLLAAGKQLGYCDGAVIYHHNRDKLWTLMREGYLHGYFGAPFRKVYADFVSSYRASYPAPPVVSSPGADQPRANLNSVQRFMLWQIFRRAKRVGALVGRWSPPAVK